MATRRLTMRKTREILRLKLVQELSHRQVARSLGISSGTVSGAAGRVKKAGRDWEAVQELTDDELEVRLYGPRLPSKRNRPLPDFAHIHRELRRAGVTPELLHLEYLEQHPGGYRYTQFCEIYRRWRKKQRRSMRQVHRAGEKMFVDYAGKKPHAVDPSTGEVIERELFVAVLGASNYTFAEATRSQRGADSHASHQSAAR